MSVRHLPLCRRNHGIGAAAKAVLYVIADHADDSGATWIGEETLQEESETSRSVMYEALGKLRKAGLVRRGRVDGKKAWLLPDPDQCPVSGQVATGTSPDAGPESPDTGLGGPVSGRISIMKHQEAPLGLDAPQLALVPAAEPPAEKGRRRRLPSDFVLTDALREAATKRGMARNVMDREFAQFCDYHQSKGSTMLDWPAAWRNWAGNHVRFNGRRAAPDGEVIYR